MGWFASIGIGVLAAAVGAVASGFVANLAVGWYRVSGREGAAGYFVVLFALLGLVVGFATGVIVARAQGGAAEPHLWALGSALAWVLGTVVVVGLVAWASAEREPTFGGRGLELRVEVRAPVGAPEPVAGDNSHVILFGAGSAYRTGDLRVGEPREVDGRLRLEGVVEVHAHVLRMLGIKLGGGDTQYIDFALPARPTEEVGPWSAWQPTDLMGDRSRPAAGTEFVIRYRVQRAAPD